MHEYSIVQSLIDRVEAEVRGRGAIAVHRLKVQVGELSGVEAELLATAYETFRPGTICAGAALELDRVPARWACRACGRDIARGAVLRCPACGAPASLTAGGDIVLEQIQMEVP